MSRVVVIEPMDKAVFAAFGDVLDTSGAADKIINQGLCGRFHDRATLDFAALKHQLEGEEFADLPLMPLGSHMYYTIVYDTEHAMQSVSQEDPRQLPLTLDMMERHPDGSQAFIPMSLDGFLVIVASDDGGKPGHPRAFQTMPGQAVNFHRGTWHGVLTPLSAPGLFAVVDRIGDGPNLEEHWFDTPYSVEPAHETAGTGLAQGKNKGGPE